MFSDKLPEHDQVVLAISATRKPLIDPFLVVLLGESHLHHAIENIHPHGWLTTATLMRAQIRPSRLRTYRIVALGHGHDEIVCIGQARSLLYLLLCGLLIWCHTIFLLQTIADVPLHTAFKIRALQVRRHTEPGF
jgi:hypothetical protein